MNRYTRNAAIIVGTTLIAGMAASVPAHAQVIGEIVERQHALSNLDHRIEKNNRLIRLQEQRVEFATVASGKKAKDDNQSQSNTQTEYFGQRPNRAEQHELAPPEKTPEQKRKERIMGALEDAVLAEAYVPQGASDGNLVGVITVDDQGYIVKEGSVIDGWKAVSVELDRAVFENAEFQERRTIYQAR